MKYWTLSTILFAKAATAFQENSPAVAAYYEK